MTTTAIEKAPEAPVQARRRNSIRRRRDRRTRFSREADVWRVFANIAEAMKVSANSTDCTRGLSTSSWRAKKPNHSLMSGVFLCRFRKEVVPAAVAAKPQAPMTAADKTETSHKFTVVLSLVMER